MSQPPPFSRRRRPPPDPLDERIAPAPLDHPPLTLPKRAAPDAVAERRARAEHLCLWMACSRVACRESRRCVGRGATCVFEHEDVTRPILDEVVQGTFGPR